MAKSRRTRGAGGLYQRADGTWVATHELPPDPQTGRRHRLQAKGKTRADAVARLKAKVQAAEMDGVLQPSSIPTLSVWLAHWLEGRSYRLRPSTQAMYTGACKRITAALGEARLDTLTPALLERWQCAAERTYAHKTVLADRSILRLALEGAVRSGLIPRNPLLLVDPPVGSATRRDAPTPDEAGRIIAAEPVAVWRLQWALAFLGMRQGERHGVTPSELDVRDGVPGIRVDHQLQQPRGREYPAGTRVQTVPDAPGWVYGPPKTKAGARWVPLLGTAWDAWQAVTAERGDIAADRLLCVNAHGRPLTPLAENKSWRKACERAGIARHLVPHSARHTADSALAAMGVPDATRIGIIGHSSTAMDAVYVHAQDDAMIDAARRLAGQLDR